MGSSFSLAMGGVCCQLGSADRNVVCLSVCLSVCPVPLLAFPFEFCHVVSFSSFKVHVLGRISAEAILTGIKVGGFSVEVILQVKKLGACCDVMCSDASEFRDVMCSDELDFRDVMCSDESDFGDVMCSDESDFCDVMCSDESDFCDVMCSDESDFCDVMCSDDSGVLRCDVFRWVRLL